MVPGQTLQLVHPWALSSGVGAGRAVTPRLGVIHRPAHASWPWSEARWNFVLRAMASQVDAIWIGDLTGLRAGLNIPASTRLAAQASRFPGYREALAKVVITPTAEPHLLPNPPRLCRSFSAFYEQARRDAGTLPELLRVTAG